MARKRLMQQMQIPSRKTPGAHPMCRKRARLTVSRQPMAMAVPLQMLLLWQQWQQPWRRGELPLRGSSRWQS